MRCFPPAFVWGTATAAFQIEGATAEDGRTDSIWDTFCRTPGAVAGGDTGDVAADHYHRMPEDVALMRSLGLGGYRFSVAWPRVLRPDGAVNQRGLDFYRRLVDRLLDSGITPFVTLYHWDLPQHLEDRGGWTSRDTAFRFAEYAQTVHAALGDRVLHWTTLNEPYCAALLGYGAGVHAPGRRDPRAAAAAAHHLLLGHGLTTQAIRAADGGARVAITFNLYPVDPADPDDPVDRDAARRVDGLQNRLWLDAVLRGRYPDDVRADLARFGFDEHVRPADLATLAAPVDALGVNYYSGYRVTGHGGPDRRRAEWIGAEHVRPVYRGLPRTAMGWEVQPEGLTRVLLRVHTEYPVLPLYVTENGAAYDDDPAEDGTTHDVERRDYLRGHLTAVHDAIERGVDVRGYFCWSLLDNFEWAEGYAKRFGIVRVDFDTLARTPKLSGLWYSRVARANALPGG
ncbi:GH1 family beta-glucosidase [Gandjariella thermophila]|nr:GH1 family beta-glucosidase [Gandjariella thermophila]